MERIPMIKRKWIKVFVNIAKYAITAILGALGGNML